MVRKGLFGFVTTTIGAVQRRAIASKLSIASKEVRRIVELVEKELETSSSVCPSGGAAATKPAPIEPAAPGRFSTTTGRPSATCSASAMGRAKLSLLPPGVKGTT